MCNKWVRYSTPPTPKDTSFLRLLFMNMYNVDGFPISGCIGTQEAQFRTQPRVPTTFAPPNLRNAVKAGALNAQPVPARITPMGPAVLTVSASAATTAAASNRQQPFKYTSTMRNPPQTVSAAQQQQNVAQNAVQVQEQKPLTAPTLLAADIEKQMLVKRLFPLIQVLPSILPLRTFSIVSLFENSCIFFFTFDFCRACTPILPKRLVVSCWKLTTPICSLC